MDQQVKQQIIKETKRFSIIIAAYNIQDYIERAIESIIKQTFQNIEIIVVNDCSTDKTGEKVKDMCTKYNNRIYIEHTENNKAGGARNTGLKIAQGEYVVFLDGDDWLEKDSLKKINKRIFMVDNNTDIIIFDYIVDYNNSSIHESFFNTELKNGKVNYSKNDLIEACICKNKVSNADGHTNLGVPWGKVYNRKYLLDSNILFKIGLTVKLGRIYQFENKK